MRNDVHGALAMGAALNSLTINSTAIAVLGNHLPRHCGIATFTTDLADALRDARQGLEPTVIAMNDAGKQHAYPDRVGFVLSDADLAGYQRAADFLNVSDVGVLSVQHEYGIFGGPAGAHLLSMLREVRVPIVTTLHTILAEPNDTQRAVMNELCTLSERLVVMSAVGQTLLERVHQVDPAKIDLIPHGIPTLPDHLTSKEKLGLEGKQVLLTFGLLSEDKGIEYVIDALPEIAARCPEVVYVVLGATHPHVRERRGESYRLMLAARARKLGVEDRVVFHDRFVSNGELVQFLAAADIYITPYLNEAQITSGTLAYAVGSGKAVISTPYVYARELLAEGRGVLVPWRDAGAIGREIIHLFEDGSHKQHLEERAAAFGVGMTWPDVGKRYLETFERAKHDFRLRAHAARPRVRLVKRASPLPEVNLGHLRAMTDDTGMLQHAAWSVPRFEDGYCVDDNARALRLMAFIEEAGVEPPATVRALSTRYLSFVRYAFDPSDGRFRNFLSHGRQWVPGPGSEDSHGRALWGLGTVVRRTEDPGRRALASELFHAALGITTTFTSPRAWAYALLGVGEVLRHDAGREELRVTGSQLAQRLMELLANSERPDWVWFEDRVTYCNARLPEALLVAGAVLKDEALVASGLRTLEWLAGVQQTAAGLFAPIGTNGFYVHGGVRAGFDQQPVEAGATVSASLEALKATGDRTWAVRARQAFDWFQGQNELEQWLYDPATGGCRDGLHRERANQNQGAESTLSFLMALLEIQRLDRTFDAKATPRLLERRHSSPLEN